MTRQASQLIREGQYAAEVVVGLEDDGGDWGPVVAPDDIRKLDRVRAALRAGDIGLAEKDAKIFRLVPCASATLPAAGFGENDQEDFHS